MAEFHDYSQFVKAAYIVSALILSGLAIASWVKYKRSCKQLNNEKSIKKKAAKN